LGLGAARGRLIGALIVAVLAAACTPDGEPDGGSSADEAARSFVSAWSQQDFETMASSFDADRSWTGEELGRWMDRALRRGAVSSYEVELRGEAVEPDGGSSGASAPYTITYESSAAAEPVALEGDLELEFDSAHDEWVPHWDEGLMWPGIDGAMRFKTSIKWPTRAAIVDQRGRKLATGSADHRFYPHGSVGGSVVGHLEPVAQKDAREPGELVGGSGLEEAFNDTLAGEPASKLTVVDPQGERLQVLGRVAATPGETVKASLNIEVQRAAETAYGGTTGGVAVLDPRTGDVLAAVASGPFDPNNYVGVAGVNPFNRALVGLYPPGSSMKVVTAAAALEEKVVTPETTLTGPGEYKGVRNFESGEFGPIPFATAVKYSVNTAFAQVAEKLGADRITRYADAFGFNRPPEMPLRAAESSFPRPQGLGDLMWASIGQAQVVATPLEMATVAATIANDGKRMEPRIDVHVRPSGERVVSRRTAAQLTTLMENVVIGGTGSAARVSGLRIAGKTGTAEVQVGGKIKNHAWFICFAPVEQPRVAVAVVSELGGIGGEVAAPLARQVLISVLPLIK
jgi:peptidoglycan glycosyltransferase